jgi:hypothetical protein
VQESHCGAHLGHQPVEHRVGGPPPDRVDRRLPHLPLVDKAAAEQGFDQLEIEAAVFLERTELLEVVELSVQDVSRTEFSATNCVIAGRNAFAVLNCATRRRVSTNGSSSQRLKNSTAVAACRPIRASRACWPAKITAPIALSSPMALTAVAIAVTYSAQLGMGPALQSIVPGSGLTVGHARGLCEATSATPADMTCLQSLT